VSVAESVTKEGLQGRYKPYPAYKNSEVEWLGEIPEHWEVKRLKFLAAEPIKNGIGEAGAYDDPDWPRYVRITDIAGPRTLREDTFKSLPPELAHEAPFKTGDLLLAAVGATYGKSYLHLQDCGSVCFAGYMVRFSPNDELLPDYAAYWSESSAYWALVQSRVVQATIQNFSAAKYKELSMPLPGIAEQHAIATFLDRETARIDALVAKKQRLIELLQEQRTALITRAVTKGLDPTARMKESGVEWLGEIPAHWEIRPFTKYVKERADYRGKTPTKVTSGIFLVTARNIRMGWIDYECSQEFVAEDEYDEIMRRGLPRIDDILFTTEAPLGNMALVDREDIALAQRVIRFRVRPDIFNSRFTLNAMMSGYFQAQLKTLSTGSTAEGLKASKLPMLWLVAPPVLEQQTIAEAIQRETEKVKMLIESISSAISRLEELRAALISAAVTGKIDVREEVV
jgi:type I restriction enzyme S subunit